MKKEALFCDGTEAYVSPPEPEAGDELQLWFRTAAHDVDEVYLENRELCIPMNKVISNKAFDFYEVKYKLEDKPFRYHFTGMYSLLSHTLKLLPVINFSPLSYKALL